LPKLLPSELRYQIEQIEFKPIQEKTFSSKSVR
jgi:hypothetical protein